MAIATSAPLWRQVPGATKFSFEEIVGPTTYVTGGIPADQTLFMGFSRIDQVIPVVTNSLTNDAIWDQVNQKIKVYVNSTQTEVGNGVDLSGTKIYALVIGR